MPLRGVGPTGRRLDLEQKSSFMNGHYVIYFNTAKIEPEKRHKKLMNIYSK
jgi:hypothetical protein